MGSRKIDFVTVLIVVVTVLVSMQQGVVCSKEFIVGEDRAWRVPNGIGFYNEWASSKRFHVGDTLRFVYKDDSVIVVDKYGYYHCDSSKATSTFNDGNSTIILDRPGLIYFISGTTDHCGVGQRLIVDVMSPRGHPIASPPNHPPYVPEVLAPAPGPEAAVKSSGSKVVPMLAQVSTLLGVVLVASMLF